MPTVVSKTVKSSGGDYSSLSSWEANEQRDLVTADEIAQAVCYGFTDSTEVLFDGWTTDATRYIHVKADPTARSACPWATGAYILTAGGSVATLDSTEDLLVEELQIQHTGIIAGTGWVCGAAKGTFKRCYLREANDSNNGRMVWRSNSTVRFENCVVEMGGNQDDVFVITANTQIENCTIIYRNGNTSSDAIAPWYGTQPGAGGHLNNNVVYALAGTPDAYVGTLNADYATNNASYNTQSIGANPVTSISDPFVDSAGGDYHNTSGSALAGAGADASSRFTDDFDGVTRSAWDIGAFEYVAAGDALVKILNDSIQSSEVALRPMALRRITTETEQTGGASLRPMALGRVTTETQQVAEVTLRPRTMARVIADTLQISEASVRALALVRAVADTLQVSEGTVRALALVRTAADTLGLTEAAVRTRSLVRIVADTLSILSGALGVVPAVALTFASFTVRAILEGAATVAPRLEPGLVRARKRLEARTEVEPHLVNDGARVRGRLDVNTDI